MKIRALIVALFVSTLLLGCGESRVPQANQPIGGTDGNWVGGGYTAPGAGPVAPGPGVAPGGFVQPGNNDYYSWYCAYDPAGCYGEYYQDYYGCDGGCGGGGGWYADFYFGSQQVARH